MLRVGVPDWVDPALLAGFPGLAKLVPVPAHPVDSIEVDFWIAPLTAKAALDVFPHLRGVKVVQSLLAGVDWLLKLLPPDLEVCDARGVHNVATAEWVVAAVLASLKYFPFYARLQSGGDWLRRKEADQTYRALHGVRTPFNPPVLIEELAGKTVLIVGYGSIGKSIEERLTAFDVEFIRVARSGREADPGSHSPPVEPVSKLKELLPLADIVVLIVPLTAETTGLMGAAELALMKQGALLVNAARGPVVETGALVKALRSGRIRAALDVTDPEPLPDGHPLWEAPNLLLTPHVAGSSPLFMVRAMRFAAEQVERYQAGVPLLNLVQGEY